MRAFRLKPIGVLVAESERGPHSLKRVLGAGDLIMLAIGAVIGAGIFGAIGTAAAGQYESAGPLGGGAARTLRRGGPHGARGRRARSRLLLPPPWCVLRAGGTLLRGARAMIPQAG